MAFPINVSGRYGASRGVSTGESRVVPPKWFRPQRKAYLADVSRLRGPSPYAGADLGYDPATLALLPGGERDLSAGAYEAGLEGINEAYAAPGGPGAGSYAHNAALAGAATSRAADVARATREATLSDAAIRREDFDRRLRAGEAVGSLALGFSRRPYRSRQQQSSYDISAGFGGG